MTPNPKEKQKHVALVVILALLVLGLWLAFVVRAQKNSLHATRSKVVEMEQKITNGNAMIDRASLIRKDLETASSRLGDIEAAMPGVDPYQWALLKLDAFKKGHNLTVLPSRPQSTRVGILPNFPYDAEKFSLRGTSYYHDLGTFIAAFETRTGREIWRTRRQASVGWGTPIAVRVGDHDEIIVNGQQSVYAYDPDDGAELWRCGGTTYEVIPTPVVGYGMVFCASGRAGPTLAIKPGGKGDVSRTHVSWASPRGSPFVPSPILYGEYLYMINDMASIVTSLDAQTGKALFQGRLGVARSQIRSTSRGWGPRGVAMTSAAPKGSWAMSRV